MSESQYRVIERVGTSQFMIQKRFQTAKKNDNPDRIERFFIKMGWTENKNSYTWRNLAKDNIFTNSYYDKFYRYFDTLDEATKVAQDLKDKGDFKTHEI